MKPAAGSVGTGGCGLTTLSMTGTCARTDSPSEDEDCQSWRRLNPQVHPIPIVQHVLATDELAVEDALPADALDAARSSAHPLFFNR